jgi:hypothetical protein
MSVERVIRIIAGTFILLSLALGIEGSPIYVSTWFWLSRLSWGSICCSLASHAFAPWKLS